MGYPGPDPVARSLRTRKAGAVGLLLTEQVSYAFRDPGAVAFLEGLTLECDEAQGRACCWCRPGRTPRTCSGWPARPSTVSSSIRCPTTTRTWRPRWPGPVPSVICDQPGIPRGRPGRHRRFGGDPWRRGPSDRAGSPPDRRDLHAARPGAAGRTGDHRPTELRALPRAAEPADRVCARPSPLPGSPGTGSRSSSGSSIRWKPGASAAAEVLALDPGITALVATSDVLALGAIEELTRRRQRVPEDVSVTGFDGIRGGHRRQADHGGATGGGEGPAGRPDAAQSGSSDAGPPSGVADDVPARPHHGAAAGVTQEGVDRPGRLDRVTAARPVCRSQADRPVIPLPISNTPMTRISTPITAELLASSHARSRSSGPRIFSDATR